MSAIQASDEHRVTWALLRLAGCRTPDRIAARLTELGIQGSHDCEACPIARYVLQQTGLGVTVTPRNWMLPGKRDVWTLPDPLRGFVKEFDRDQYPHLTEGEPA